MTAAETVSRARRLNASNEAIIRAAVAHMPRPDAVALLAKISSDLAREHQAAVHAAPIGSRKRKGRLGNETPH